MFSDAGGQLKTQLRPPPNAFLKNRPTVVLAPGRTALPSSQKNMISEIVFRYEELMSILGSRPVPAANVGLCMVCVL